MKYVIFIVCLLVFTNCKKEEKVDQLSSAAVHEAVVASDDNQTITVCSFNIQFLGLYHKKDAALLADILKGYDIVVIQELVAPPVAGTYPDGSVFSADEEAKVFFDKMSVNGFAYLLSEEDTGTNPSIHSGGSGTEWWVAFYDPGKIKQAVDLPNGFLDDDRSDNDDFERVPYAFAFRTLNDHLDFVLISVHLDPDDHSRRAHELTIIKEWIKQNNNIEKDFIILGDMNIKDRDELTEITPSGYVSLNDECRPTNTLLTNPRPYDHVMYDTTFTKSEIDMDFDFHVVNLIEVMQSHWANSEPYPGDPYVHNTFRQIYSDHHPVVFRMVSGSVDDD